jgi:uncharacterized protein (DUF433 family)
MRIVSPPPLLHPRPFRLLDLLASGMSSEEILSDYSGLDEANLRACIAYGAEMARERYVEVPLGESH